tara:strand:+ start:922 stop:1107 length:186 start_codon:yes stop_codon:yes gene_type:complete
MSYVIADITFYKVDEDGNDIVDADGKLILFEPKGRWKQLEHLTEGCDDSDFQPIHKEKKDG